MEATEQEIGVFSFIRSLNFPSETVRRDGSFLRIFYCFCRGAEVQKERKGDHPHIGSKEFGF